MHAFAKEFDFMKKNVGITVAPHEMCWQLFNEIAYIIKAICTHELSPKIFAHIEM